MATLVSTLTNFFPLGQYLASQVSMPLMWSHEFDIAMLVVEIVPVAKFQHPFARVFYVCKSFVGIVRSVFTRFKK
jgi:hypothetical protein